MNQDIRGIVSDMTLDEKRELVAELKAAIAEEMAAEPGDPQACPRCGCPAFVKKGRSADGSQRWLCKGCGRTFGARTPGLPASSKPAPPAWAACAECMADGLTLRESAARRGAGLPTSWFMRQRLCEVMRARLQPFRGRSSCQVDGLEVEENLSGNHSRSGGFEMPRDRHRSGSDRHKRGVSNEKMCVMTGANEYGDEFAVLACRGRETVADVVSSCGGFIAEGASVSTDMHRPCPRAMEALGASSHVKVDPKDRSAGDINLVNSMHSRLRAFLAPFHGVATRRLQRYLDWFCCREQFRNSDADRREVLCAHAAEGRYEHSRRAMFAMPHPFMEYWDGRVMLSTVV